MRIGNQENAGILLVHRPQEVQRARQVTDAMRDVVVDLHNVDTESLTPVIQAIPFEIALHGTVLLEQVVACRFKGHSIGGGIAPRHQFFPDVVVEGKIEQGAVHVEHQRLAALQRSFRIDIHWYTARPV